ncbi:MAG: roadblock/LC7 domain-containing protein [candidate division NC10 bacterium]|nr:roadblock/LC7 domain-containing protein [candidate division NC10 bacterium]
MSHFEATEALTDLLGRVAGVRSALLLDANGSLVAQADREGLADAPLFAISCHRVARETLAAAERLGQGPVGQILLEAERGALAILPWQDGRVLCLVLSPLSIPGQVFFEARRLMAALSPAP